MRPSVLALSVPAVAALTAVALATPSSASPAQLAGADDHSMGSTVAAHEGVAPAVAAAATSPLSYGPRGMDVSRWQGNVSWSRAWANGARFAYVKATESTTYTNPYFGQQYNGSYGVGMIRGAYHFALPDRSSGATQADFFVDHGGGWSPDGRTLPPLLDIEYNPYGATCYGLSRSAMVSWLHAFSIRVRERTGRTPAMYTTTDWWRTCTGDDPGFNRPLFLARYSSSIGTLPAGFPTWTMWQYSDSGTLPGDQDVFHGSLAQLQALARG